MRKLQDLISVQQALELVPLDVKHKEFVENSKAIVREIFVWSSSKKLLLIGPCSIDFTKPVLEYAKFVKHLRDEFGDKLEIIMRFYTQKPRTTLGWKWFVYSHPWEDPNINDWILRVRALAREIIDRFEVPLADELLYPEITSRYRDVFSYVAIGARSTENQLHREVISWLDVPSGFKNPTSWEIRPMVNSIIASRAPHVFVLWDAIWQSEWNPYTQWILRWWSQGPNYFRQHLMQSKKLMQEAGVLDGWVLIDVAHWNSQKDISRVPQIVNYTLDYLQDVELKDFFKWWMIESYIEEGNQSIDTPTPIMGKSFTDPVISKDTTYELVKKIYEALD